MGTYNVSVGGTTTYEADFIVDADSREEAIRLVIEGEADREQFFASEEFGGKTSYYADYKRYLSDGTEDEDGDLIIKEKEEDEDDD